jgi:hypothetical protein
MAVWQPHKLSIQLGRLFDGGYCDVDTFARLCGESPRLIEKIVSSPGFRVSRECELRIGRILAGFMVKNPELYHDPGPPQRDPKRGVFEQASHRTDERQFALYDSRGKWRGTFLLPAEECDDATMEWLWRVLNKRDPDGVLKAI